MTINRNNYEEFFLLYVDNELDAGQRTAVEAFAAAYPDLKEELNTLLQTKLSPAEEISFESKILLYKQEIPGLITADNYETFFLLYADNELPAAQRAAVERFVEEHPAKKQEWVLLQHTRLQADDSIVCPDKKSLYNIGKKPSRIIPLAWMRAAAAAVIITGGLLWMNTGNKTKLAGGAQQQIAATSPDTKPGRNISRDMATTNRANISSSEKAAVPADKQEATYGNNTDQKDVVKTTAKKSAPMPETAPAVDARSVLQEPAATIVRAPEQQPVKAQPVYEAALTPQEDVKKKEPAPVKPVILDAAAFNGDRDITAADQKETEDMHYLSTNNDDKRSKGKFRGLFRKASRLIDRVTNAGTEDEKSIVRVASFEIVKK